MFESKGIGRRIGLVVLLCSVIRWRVEAFFYYSPGTPSRRDRCHSTSRSRLDAEVNRLHDVVTLQNQYFVLRHGQSEANVAKIIASNPTIACQKYGLSSLGKEQARKAGQDVLETFRSAFETKGYLGGILLISSDLLRAKETAEAVETAVLETQSRVSGEPIHLHRGQVILETRLRERSFGDWDLTSDTNYNEVWKDDAVDASHEIKGVESVTSVMDRVTECILDWDSQVNDHMVICVAHGDVLQILQTCFSKLDGSQHRTLDHLETATLRKLELRA